MKIRCKMKCETITKRADGTYSVLMHPVTSGSAENEYFFKWTPSGILELHVLKDDNFEPGKEYYVDIKLSAKIECQ